MSLLAVLYKLVPESPILIAFNKDDVIEKPQPKPTIQSGKPRVLASVHPQSGGTSLGVNQHGMFVGITPRRKTNAPFAPKQVDTLVRTLLRAGSARRGLDLAMDELNSGQYEGANLVIADYESGWVLHAGNEITAQELDEGLSIVGEHEVDDPRDERVGLARRLLTLQMLDSPVKFLAVASKVFARSPSAPGRATMVMNEPNCKTVSSTLIALGKKPRDAIFQYSAGSPDRNKYEDYSPMLRDILSRGLRESRQKAKT
jgi:uncharacterized protein with NRDE domain